MGFFGWTESIHLRKFCILMSVDVKELDLSHFVKKTLLENWRVFTPDCQGVFSDIVWCLMRGCRGLSVSAKFEE